MIEGRGYAASLLLYAKKMKDSFTAVRVALAMLLKKPSYVIIAGAVAFLIMVIAVLLPNREFVRFVVFHDTFSFGTKVNLLWVSLGALKTNFTMHARVTVIVSALLSGINIALLVFHMRRRALSLAATGTTSIGTVIGLLGVGCAACGSVLLTSLFGLSTTIAIIGFLPFKGGELGYVSIAILLWSVQYVAKKISDPAVCAIPEDEDV